MRHSWGRGPAAGGPDPGLGDTEQRGPAADHAAGRLVANGSFRLESFQQFPSKSLFRGVKGLLDPKRYSHVA